eukprot:29403-Pelagococcus_subviridis.AAC.3
MFVSSRCRKLPGESPTLIGVEGPSFKATNVGVELKGVRSGVERRASRCVGIESSEGYVGGDNRRRNKSLRIGVHHADAVVRGPV